MSESKKEKTAYYISKNVNVDEMREIKENFEDPSKYLSLDPRIVVGLLPFKSKKHPISNNIIKEENNSQIPEITEKEKEIKSDNNKRPETSSTLIIFLVLIKRKQKNLKQRIIL